MCPFYKFEYIANHSNEINEFRQVETQYSEIPYCNHEQSPVTLMATKVIGGANMLICGGNLNCCQVGK